MRVKSLIKLTSLLFLINLSDDLLSQQMNRYSPVSLSSNEYDRASKFFNRNAESFTSGTSVNPNWISGNEFWYKNQVFGGHEFILIDIDQRIIFIIYSTNSINTSFTPFIFCEASIFMDLPQIFHFRTIPIMMNRIIF